MAAAAVMMFASCSNEEVLTPENPFEGKTSEVAIAMSVKGTKATPEEVNMDGNSNIATIKNVVIVPMIGTNFQNPILFGDFADGDKQKTVTRTLSQNVNKFRVYGNATAGSDLKEQKIFTKDDLKMSISQETTINEKPYYAPHALYYYKEDANFQMATGETFDWSASTSWSTSNGSAIGANNLVKIGGVKYQVGVLAALLINGDNKTQFYNNVACGEDDKISADWENDAPITVTGITVEDQTESFDIDFKPSSNKVDVYEKASLDKIYKDATIKLSNTNRSVGNVYCVVAPSEVDKNVNLNFEFQVKDGVYFKLHDGTVVGGEDNDKFYLRVSLDKSLAEADSQSGVSSIFEAEKSTLLNATVTDWGLGSKTPIESTDVTIGVVFDVDWVNGLVFDIEI